MRGLSVGRVHVNVFEILRILLELRIDFQNDMVLIQLSENGGDQALTIGVVERVVDVRGKNSEPRGRIAINDHACLQAVILLIAGHVA